MARAALSAIILSGGKSTRMGRDKAWLMLDGQPLAERVARRVLPLADEVIFSANGAGPYAELAARLPVPARVVADLYADAGPLGGLHAGLLAAQNELALLLAVDMPFVNLALLEHMIGLSSGYDMVVPMLPIRTKAAEGRELAHEPLHALYRKSCLPAIEAVMSAGKRQVIAFYPAVRVRKVLPDEIVPFDPDYRSFYNANTPEDWERVRGEGPPGTL